jgi:hypothetical protein
MKRYQCHPAGPKILSGPAFTAAMLATLGHVRKESARQEEIFLVMPTYRHSSYFELEVLRKRPCLRREWCVAIIEHPVRVERQEDNRFRFWGTVPELGGRYRRVITLEARTTIHNAFPDRGFRS